VLFGIRKSGHGPKEFTEKTFQAGSWNLIIKQSGYLRYRFEARFNKGQTVFSGSFLVDDDKLVMGNLYNKISGAPSSLVKESLSDHLEQYDLFQEMNQK
jgi:hypothetical protein